MRINLKPLTLLAVFALFISACSGGGAPAPTQSPVVSEAPAVTQAPIEPATPAATTEAPSVTTAPATVAATAALTVTQSASGAALPTQPPVEPPPGLELAALQSATYRTGFTNSGTAILTAGKYSEPSTAGGAATNSVTLVEPVTYGRLPDGRVVAAVILVSETGGSGTFYELDLMGQLEDGTPLNLGYVFLGDRIKINSVSFLEDGSIAVDMLTAGPNDPLSSPTLQQTLIIRYLDGQLVKETPTPVPGAPVPGATLPAPIGATPPITNTTGGPAAPTTLTSVVWQWVEFENKDVGRLSINQPYLYLMEFTSDGQVRINADCNSGTGAYQAQDDKLMLSNLVTTLAACPAGSLFSLYMESLNNVSTYVVNNGFLYITLKDNGGVMKFGPQP